MNVSTETQQLIPQDTVKAVLSLLPCLFFLYVNAVMMFALLRKPLLLESSRYILFGHLLLTDSLQLAVTMTLYIFALTMVRMISSVCIAVFLMGTVFLQMSPLILALMSLERYVAICFPLRHSSIATPRATSVAITVMWVLASLDSVTQLFLFISLENSDSVFLTVCSKPSVFRLQIYLTLSRAFTILYFVSVSVIIIYTYIAVLVTVRSASSAVRNTKAHKTVLLHLFQLCLCLTSTLFGMINSGNRADSRQAVAHHVQYLLFLGLLVFPKFLSPLIYGLRDQTFSHVFKYYFTFGIKTTIRPFSKPDVLNTVIVE
ncbi:odorant receptor 131-2-like [Salarias fasciatus]|uniref:odorant receptor 131-2-like n=1 Tax=Salarias fasciatus TaxID=181472 RepID=UPI0011768469|nr:odorant receptor 131-2-like [Salarias fasciatus]